MDEGDYAQKREAEMLADALARHKREPKQETEECVECGTEIPEERRKVGGIDTCIDCQADIERRNRMHR